MALLLSISEVNELKDYVFARLFKNVIELWPHAAVEVRNSRPFADVADLVNSFYRYLDDLNEDDKLKVLKSHPDLAGKLAISGDLTSESAAEQSSAGLSDLSSEQKTVMDSLNARYKSKFGFPFIICARDNKVQAIIAGLQQRCHNTKEEEIITGITEVKKICKLRILDIVKNNN